MCSGSSKEGKWCTPACRSVGDDRPPWETHAHAHRLLSHDAADGLCLRGCQLLQETGAADLDKIVCEWVSPVNLHLPQG